MGSKNELLERLGELHDFCGFLDAELNVRMEPGHADLPLSALPQWDSMHVVRLTLLLERSGRIRVPLGRLLDAASLRELHATVLEAGGGAP